MIVDDDPLVRLGLADLIGSASDMRLVAQAGDGLQALHEASTRLIHVALVDIRMPRMDGIATIAALRALPDPPRTIALTTFDVDEYVYSAIRAGADGFLLKDTEPAEILQAVRLVVEGSAILHPAAARRLIDSFHSSQPLAYPDADQLINRLTHREKDVLRLLARGESNADIASALGMRESTVKAHVSRILAALGVSNRVQAALAARDGGLQ